MLRGNRPERYRGQRKHPVSLSTIPTWKQVNEGKDEDSTKYYKRREFVFKPNDEFNDKISTFIGDMTTLQVDALVNQATDESLSGRSGLDEAVHIAAGHEMLYECSKLIPCELGSARITKGYRLPARYVIHTVGPVGERPRLLRNCYDYSLFLAKENNLRTIAFPCISTGNYIYPSEKAAHIALQSVRQFMETDGACITRIVFCMWDPIDIEIYKKMLHLYFPLPPVVKVPKPLVTRFPGYEGRKITDPGPAPKTGRTRPYSIYSKR